METKFQKKIFITYSVEYFIILEHQFQNKYFMVEISKTEFNTSENIVLEIKRRSLLMTSFNGLETIRNLNGS